MTLLQFDNVSVQRGEEIVLKDFSLTIKEGEDVALLGPNGSGKSTFLKCVTRELYPGAGSVKLFGKADWDVFALRKKLGIVSGDIEKFAAEDVSGRGIPGLEAVLSGYFSSVGVAGKVTPEMLKQARRTLKFLGADHLSKRPMTKVSAGEARRLLIARALVNDPRALILDEPTNSLDIAAFRAFRKILIKLGNAGKSLLIVTHRLEDIVPQIKRVVLLKKGTIFADGPIKEVLTDKLLTDLFETPVHVHKNGSTFHLI